MLEDFCANVLKSDTPAKILPYEFIHVRYPPRPLRHGFFVDDSQCLWDSSMHCLAVCETINTKLGPNYLHLPRDNEEIRQKVSEFEMRFGTTKAYGCIGGTHIPLKRPLQNSQDYFCCQAVFLSQHSGYM